MKDIEKEHGTNFILLKIVALSLLLAGCQPEPTGFTSPLGIVYLNGGQNNEQLVAHEEAHWAQYQRGELDFIRYLTNEEYRCGAEIRANIEAEIFPYNDHPFCNGIEK